MFDVVEDILTLKFDKSPELVAPAGRMFKTDVPGEAMLTPVFYAPI